MSTESQDGKSTRNYRLIPAADGLTAHPLDLVFTGDGSMTVDTFLRNLRKKAVEAGKARDSDWMADYLGACVEGPALLWYEGLDESTRGDWSKLRTALISGMSSYGRTEHHPRLIDNPAPTEPTQMVQETPGIQEDSSRLARTLSVVLPAAPDSEAPPLHTPENIPRAVIGGQNMQPGLLGSIQDSIEERYEVKAFTVTPPGVFPSRLALRLKFVPQKPEVKKGAKRWTQIFERKPPIPDLGSDIITIWRPDNDGQESFANGWLCEKSGNTLTFSPDGTYLAFDTSWATGTPRTYTYRCGDDDKRHTDDYNPYGYGLCLKSINGTKSMQYNGMFKGDNRCFAFSPTDMSMAVVQDSLPEGLLSYDNVHSLKGDRTIVHMDIVTGELKAVFELSGDIEVVQLAFIPEIGESRLVVLLSTGIINIGRWSPDAQSIRLRVLDCPRLAFCLKTISLGPASYALTAGGGKKRGDTWDAQDSIYTWKSQENRYNITSSMVPLLAESYITAMAYSSNCKLLACRGRNVSDGIWDVEKKTPITLPPTLTRSPWKEMAFLTVSSRGVLATLHGDGKLRLHDVDPEY